MKSGHGEDGLAVIVDVEDKVRSISNLKTCWKMTEGIWLVVKEGEGRAGKLLKVDHRQR